MQFKNMSTKVITKSPVKHISESSTVSFKIVIANKAIKNLRNKISILNQCKQILDSPDKNLELHDLTDKWTSINKACLNHLHNAYLIKYKENSGYIKSLEESVNMEKEKIKYQANDNLEYEWETIQESTQYQMLDDWEKVSLKASFEERIAKNEEFLESSLKKLDKTIEDFNERGGEFDLEELCKNLKIDYSLIYT